MAIWLHIGALNFGTKHQVSQGFPKHRNPDPTSCGQKTKSSKFITRIFFENMTLHIKPIDPLTQQSRHKQIHIGKHVWKLWIPLCIGYSNNPKNCNSWGHHNWPRVSCTYVARDSNTLTSPPGFMANQPRYPRGHVFSPQKSPALLKAILTIGFP